MQELINLLTRERVLIERLLYRVTNLRNLLVGGQPRFLAWATDEVEDAARTVSEVEVTRATYYQRLTDTRTDLPAEFDWEALLGAATDTQAALLRSLRSDIGATATETRAHLATCRELGERGQATVTAALAQLQGVDLTAATHLPASVDARKHLNQTL